MGGENRKKWAESYQKKNIGDDGEIDLNTKFGNMTLLDACPIFEQIGGRN